MARWTEHPNVTQQYLSRVRTGKQSTSNNTSQQREREGEREREWERERERMREWTQGRGDWEAHCLASSLARLLPHRLKLLRVDYAGLPANRVPDRDRTHTGPNPRHISWWHASFSYMLIPFGKVLAAKDWKSIQIWLIQIMSYLTFWFGDLIPFGQVLAAKDWESIQIWIEKVFKSGWFKSCQIWPSGLATLIPFGQALAAKDWKSVRIWLVQIMSNLTFWFGDFDSFCTGLGCQSLRKYSNLAVSIL